MSDLILPDSDRIKTVNYAPGPTAEHFLLSPARVKLAWGPIRTGKSVALTWQAFLKAQECAEKGVALRALFLRDTFRNLSDTLLKTWLEWFGHMGVLKRNQSVVDFELHVGGIKHEIMFRHGQTAQDASSFLSSEYGFIGLEEVAPAFTPSGLISPGIAEDVFDIGIQRLVQKGVENPVLAATCNPPLPQHWAYKRLIAEDPVKLKDKNWWHFFFPTAENEKNLRKGYYSELRKSLEGKDHLIKRFLDGEVVSVHPGMPVFAGDFKQHIHVRPHIQPIPGRPLILGWDYGLTPAVVITQIDAKGRWLILYEIQGGYVDDKLSEQIGVESFGKMVINALSSHFNGFSISNNYGGQEMNEKAQTDEKTCKQILESLGFKNWTEGEKEIMPRTEALRGRMTQLLDGEPALLVSRSGAPLLVEALSGGYRYNVSKDMTKLFGSEPVKDMYSHIVDAAASIASKRFKVAMVPEVLYKPIMAPSPWVI
jgi:hypothetical protein